MPSQAVVFRFPQGPEYVFTESVPKIGDTLTRGQDRWEVVAVGTDESGNSTVTLRALESLADMRSEDR